MNAGNAAADSTRATAAGPAEALPSTESGAENWRYWVRPLLLGVLVVALLALNWWDDRRVPDRPAPPDVTLGAPGAGAAVTGADARLTEALLRLQSALSRGDARTLAGLAHPQGLVLAAFGGGLPERGYAVSDATKLSQDALSGGRVAVHGWRTDGQGRVIVLTDGWKHRLVRFGSADSLELTSLAALGFTSEDSRWYWRWLMPDTSGVLAQQAKSMVWNPWPS